VIPTVPHKRCPLCGGTRSVPVSLGRYRVLRPGGYLIHTVWDKVASTRGTLLLESLAAKMNWKLLASYETLGHNVTKAKLRGDTVPYDCYKTVYQMPSYKYSKR
jgi:predicted acetyltransferase